MQRNQDDVVGDEIAMQGVDGKRGIDVQTIMKMKMQTTAGGSQRVTRGEGYYSSDAIQVNIDPCTCTRPFLNHRDQDS